MTSVQLTPSFESYFETEVKTSVKVTPDSLNILIFNIQSQLHQQS